MPTPTPTPTPSPTPSPTPAPTPTPTGVTARSSITDWGINGTFVSDSYADKLFADCLRTCRYTTVADAFDTTGGLSISVDAQGYPLQDFGLFLWDSATGVDFSGTYGLSFTGQAEILPDGFTLSNYQYDWASDKTTADLHMVVGGSGVLRFRNTQRISTSAVNSGLSNVKIMRPVSNGASTYYPTTTTFTDPIKVEFGLFTRIRFLDMMLINGNPSSSWAQRVLPSQRDQQGDNGISWEYAIGLCNETNSDAYICIPVKADDDYIQQLALLFKNGSTVNGVTYAALNSNLKIYIEYGNELWNDSPGFGQGEMVRLMAIAEMQATNGASALNYDNSWDGTANGNWYLKYRYAGRRVTQIAQTWQTVFGTTAYNAQVYPLYMWQQFNGNATGDIGLAMIERIADGLGVATNTLVKAGGGSHYYSPDNGSDTLTIDSIWSSGSFDEGAFARILECDLAKALGHGLQYLSYEGGPGLDNTGHSESVKIAAWSDPRMRTLVVNQHKLIEQYTGTTTYYYAGGTGSGYYQWGFTQDPSILNSQKLLAIQDLNARSAQETPTIGTMLPATVAAASYAVTGDSDTHSPAAASVSFVRTGWDETWLFRSATDRTYGFTVTYDGTNPPQLKIRVNGIVQYSGTFTATSDYGTPVSSPIVSLSLKAGVNAIRFSVISGDTNFYNLSLS